jgi:DNA polymerase-3 subunit gamma/tau
VDVIEIDAASNRGINEMRELRENVRYRPARDRYKVFIIDEAHQITTEAFNALLKTLEEPPEWVVFILCTTEAHKIPITIASRCQQFSFRSVDFGELVARMKWICGREGIQADDESLAILAQAGEGSVRDSLSALDQAISCCGTTLDPAELRTLLGTFGIESLATITEALEAGDPARMLSVVQELEANGRNLQHFCRELSRYFRNLLVAKIAGGETRLIGASAAEQTRMRDIAARFSEEDLTRYLQLTLDTFKDLQTSIQPRLHLELGFLKLVQVGKLTAIEEALASLGTAPLPAPMRNVAPKPAGPSPFERDSVRKTPRPNTETGDIKQALHTALMELGMNFTADAVDHSDITEANGELVFVTPKRYSMAMKQADLTKGLQAIGKTLRVKVTVGEPANATSVAAPEKPTPASDDEVAQRALADPAVRRFQETFPDAQIRAIRNLKQD